MTVQRLLLFVAALGIAVPASAQPFVAAHGLNAAEYQAYIDSAARRHLRPRKLDVATVNRNSVFSVILEAWDETDPQQAWGARHGMTAADYQQAFDDFAGAGFRPVSVSGYQEGNQTLFAAIWHYDKNAIYFGRHGMTSDEFQQTFDAFAASACSTRIGVDVTRGELVDVDGRVPRVTVRGRGAISLLRRNVNGLRAGLPGLLKRGACQFRLYDLDAYKDGHEIRYVALWRYENGGYAARHGMTKSQFDFEYQVTGLEPVNIGAQPDAEPAFSSIWYWQPGEVHFVFKHETSAEYQATFNAKASQGYWLMDIAAYEGADGTARYNSLWRAPGGPDTYLQLVLPIGGVPNKDWVIVNYQDHDPTSGRQDYNNGTWNYDGHNGIDITLKNFDQMDAPGGVPVFAAADGVVKNPADGEFDHDSCGVPGGTCSYSSGFGNNIEIEHANGQHTRYAHLKLGSLLVADGDFVVRGQQIAQVGSSGNSSDAHLHFMVKDPPAYSDNASALPDPFEGPAHTGQNMWMTALPYGPTVLNVLDADVVNYNPTRLQFSYRPDHVNTFTTFDTLYLWIQMSGTADATKTLEYALVAPNSMTFSNSWTGQSQYRWLTWNYSTLALSLAGGTGTWHFIVKQEGAVVFDRSFKIQ